jgi:hypothetical protein
MTLYTCIFFYGIYSGRKKYGASASKLRTLAELYFRSQMCQRGLFFVCFTDLG